MAPKKAAAPKAKSTKAAAPRHASFSDMIKDAILNLKDRNGSSRQAIKKYIMANNDLGALTEAAFNKHISRALETGDGKTFEFPKGKSGPVKLKKPGTSKPAEKSEKPKTEKKATKAKSTSKTAPAKKAAPTKKTTTKKAAPKAKANASKPRKTAPAAPAVEDKPAVVLGKTKSGRVTKTKAPQAAKPAKKAAPKKSATKKAPKKSTTPKKAEAKAEA